MKIEYKVTRYITNTTEEEREEIYQELANIFVRMAQKDRRKTNEKIQME